MVVLRVAVGPFEERELELDARQVPVLDQLGDDLRRDGPSNLRGLIVTSVGEAKREGLVEELSRRLRVLRAGGAQPDEQRPHGGAVIDRGLNSARDASSRRSISRPARTGSLVAHRSSSLQSCSFPPTISPESVP